MNTRMTKVVIENPDVKPVAIKPQSQKLVIVHDENKSLGLAGKIVQALKIVTNKNSIKVGSQVNSLKLGNPARPALKISSITGIQGPTGPAGEIVWTTTSW